ncbi:2,3-bisphosphoglycerate-dependent phosphoglycerate mutase [Streptomyces sp. GZWMJZ-114]|uniref:2,3-bisphosphoglycerate-dependent phosphoglycerate mutase n=1 Tax=Streptomyces sp. GZWMJZ-114 TaxID=2494734 RepID=UPI001011F78B|nr:2,3-bisphosphoglycerate-dependent phosphoglycerate mutase [Streptomyces sp. GZWMJZ-114]
MTAAPYTLLLLRHGESTANADNCFTGWTDAPLTDLGRQQARTAGELLKAAAAIPDVVHTSVLRRTITTADIVSGVLGRDWLPVHRSWRLNERHYGALTGQAKTQVLDRTDATTYHQWRRSWDTAPPPAAPGALPPWGDDRYADLPPDVWPLTESLHDVYRRLMPYWTDQVVPDLVAGRTPLIVAHGNSLRALVAHLDRLSPPDIEALNIPTGQPLRYDLGADFVPLAPGGTYLDPATAAREAEAVRRQ